MGFHVVNINGVEIDTSRLKILADIGTENQIRLTDGTNILTINGDGELLAMSKLDPTHENLVRITDGINKISVTASGELKVATPTPATPSGRTVVLQSFRSDVSGTNTQTYIIPNGETLTLQYVQVGAEDNDSSASRIALYYAPNGTLDGNETILANFYVNGTNATSFIDQDFVGDGIKAIILERARLGGGTAEMFGKWQGYY